jgi:hypothetical protein
LETDRKGILMPEALYAYAQLGVSLLTVFTAMRALGIALRVIGAR